MSASGRHGLGLIFASSALSQVHACAVSTIETSQDPFTKPVHLFPSLLGALALTAYSCSWLMENNWLHSRLDLVFSSILLFSFSFSWCRDGSLNSGASWWKAEVVYGSDFNWNTLFKRFIIWEWKVFRESVFTSLNSFSHN